MSRAARFCWLLFVVGCWADFNGCSAPNPVQSCFAPGFDCPIGTFCDPQSQRCVGDDYDPVEHCATFANCSDSARPLCSGGFCVACNSIAASDRADLACQALGMPNMRACLRDGASQGQCAECRPPAAAMAGHTAPADQGVPCADLARPICDGGACRACLQHSDCIPSGLCNDGSDLIDLPGLAIGECVPKERVMFVDAARCPAPPTGTPDGSYERPYCDLSAAVGRGDYINVSALGAGPYPPLSFSSGKRTVIVGPGRDGSPLLSSIGVSGAGTSLWLVDVSLVGSAAVNALTCSSGASVSLRHSSIDLSNQGSVGIDAESCDRLEVAESRIAHSPSTALRIGSGTRSYRVVNSLLFGNAGASAVIIAASAGSGQAVFAFNTLINNGVMEKDGGAISCETGGQPLLTDSLIVQNGHSSRTDMLGQPLGTQFVGPCRLQRVVVGADAAAFRSGDMVLAAIPDLDSKLRLLATPNNGSCCIDKAGPCDDLHLDYFGNQRPLGAACDLGAHELR